MTFEPSRGGGEISEFTATFVLIIPAPAIETIFGMNDKQTGDDQLLSEETRRVLTDLFEDALRMPSAVSAVHFRARHHESLDLIDDMIALGLIESKQDTRTYSVKLVGVAELSPTNANASGLMKLCAQLFELFREVYRSEPEKKLLVTEVANSIHVPVESVRLALSYLCEAGLFAGYSTDLNRVDANVVLSEAFIRRKSFNEVLAERRGWLRQQMRDRRRIILSPLDISDLGNSNAEGETFASTSRPRSFRTPFETYTALRQLGQGGSGFVWLAKDEDGNEVAIKYMDPSKVSSDTSRRFRNEMIFCLRSSHRNVLQIKDFGEVNAEGKRTLFYVMPRYDSTLREAMKKPIPSADALAVFEKILDGVEAAHIQRVWHRDLKPENILLSADLADVRVADFGIAHFEQRDLYADAETKVGDRLANYRYAAPEQRDPKAHKNHLVDIFALGLMLNEIFTGEVPQGSSYRKIGEAAPEHAYLDGVAEQMIRQQPGERPESVAEVRKLLRDSNPATRSRRAESSTVLFSRRFGEAFPGVRGTRLFNEPLEAIERLEILLRQPLIVGNQTAIWWWRNGDMHIESVTVPEPGMILMDGHELIVDRVAAVNARSYYQQFVYLEGRAAEPSGLNDYSHVSVEVNTFGFAREEFGIYRGHAITRAEYDDGSAVIDGKPVRFEESPELRVRYLTPWNILIAPVDSPINNTSFDGTRDDLMNRILRRECDLEELVEAVLRLPKRDIRR